MEHGTQQSPMTLSDDGAMHFPQVDTDRWRIVADATKNLPQKNPGVRIYGIEAIRELLSCKGAIGAIVTNTVGDDFYPVRAILFDKTEETNWSLGWHQDRTICVRERRPVKGFGPWTVKAGMHHVEPPFELLSRMVTIRVHLDDVSTTNAPLLIAPASHNKGRISIDNINQMVSECGVRTCLAKAGDIWMYSTPILHASNKATNSGHRRVLQVDFSPDHLPDGLDWMGI